MSADFRLKETPNGDACFESITCPGMCISISTITQIQSCHFSISRLVCTLAHDFDQNRRLHPPMSILSTCYRVALTL